MSEPGNRICQICQRREAAYYCTCLNPPMLFCLKCCSRHHAKHPLTIHNDIPIAALSHYRNPEDYLKKYETLKKGEAELRRNLQQMDQFVSEFEDSIQKCINDLTEYGCQRLQLLQTEKAQFCTKIEAAVQEATNCLNQGTAPVSGLAQAMWFLPSERLKVFRYSVATPDLQIICDTWISYQNNLQSVCEELSQRPVQLPEEEKQSLIASNPQDMLNIELQTDVFAHVSRTKVEILNLSSGQSIYHTIKIDFGRGGSYIQVDSQTLFCLGAKPVSASVYSLDLPSMKFTVLDSLLTPRDAAGVAKANNTVYVFGGRSSPVEVIQSCEKYGLRDRMWWALGNMHEARFSFTPCIFKTLIYLPFSPHSLSIETFSPATETFTDLSLFFPPGLKENSSVSFVVNGELCILTSGKQMARWRIETDTIVRLFSTDRECWSSQPPLIVGSLIFIGNNYNLRERVEKFSIISYTFV